MESTKNKQSFRLRDKNYIYIIGACVFTYAFYLIAEYFYTDGQMGVPLDDSWIHFRFAENLAKGYLYQFNVGQPVAGSTSPLWVVILAGFSFITSNYIFNSVFLSAVFHLLSCIFIYKIALKIFSKRESTKESAGFIALMIALITAITGRFAWAGLSGMETSMFTFLCIVGIYAHMTNLEQKKFNLIPSILFALATVSRPESFLLFGLYIFDVGMISIKEKIFARRVLPILGGILIFIIITAPYFIFSHFTSESFLPTTFRGQGGSIHFPPDREYIKITLEFLFSDNPIIATLYLLSWVYYILRVRKNYFGDLSQMNLIFLWVIMLPLVSAFLIPNYRHHGRYMMPLLPFINMIAIYIFFSLRDMTKDVKFKELMSRKSALIIIMCFSLFYYLTFARAIGMNTQNINDQQVELANWVKENVPQDETIAINDIGAITFISKNKVVDMAGLVTPQILRYRTYRWEDNMDSTYYLLKNNNVSYVIIYDDWFKGFLDDHKENFEYVRSAILEDNTICGGEEMKVYKFRPTK